jgi:hypothetical protein
MPRRPRFHVLEDISRNKLHEAFGSVGWTVEDLRQDYGEDLFVRIFVDEVATPLSFFVQAKGTDNIVRHTDSHTGKIEFPVKRRHVEHWNQFWEPVILSLWDSKSNSTSWNCVQTYLSTKEGEAALAAPSDSIKIPLDKRLDSVGLVRIHAIAKSRFEHAENEKTGTPELIRFLQEQLKIEIDYDPHGILFITRPGELTTACFFGKMAEGLSKFAKHWGCSNEETYPVVMKMAYELFKDPELLAVLREYTRTKHEFDGNGEDSETFLELLHPPLDKFRTQPGLPDIEELRKLIIGRR